MSRSVESRRTPFPIWPSRSPVVARWTPRILALLFCFFWSSAFTANKINLRYAPPLWNLAIRCSVAGVIILAYAAWARVSLPATARAYGRLALFGLFNTTLYMLFTLLGLLQVSAGTAAIIASTHPVVLALVAPFALKERLTTTKWLGILLGMSAIWWVMATRIGSDDTVGGMAWIAAGVGSLIVGTLLFKRYPPRESLLMVNGIQLMTSGGLLLPLAWLDSSPAGIEWGWPLVLGLGYVTIAVNIMGMAIWLWLLRRNAASTVSAYYFLTPIMGLGLSALVLGDQFGSREVAGLVVVATAIYLVNRPPKELPTSTRSPEVEPG